MTVQTATTTTDDGLLAAISHFFGFVVALVIWAVYRDKSRFVRFQPVQAMAFDVLVSVVTILAIGCIVAVTFGILVISVGDIALFSSQNNPTTEPARVLISMMPALPFLIVCLVVPLVVLTFGLRLVATVQTFQGKDFRYPWLGGLVERATSSG
jgi:uncharacterized Tic20 family protein